MKIYSDGKSRVLSGAFPKHFRLLNGEKEVPFIRTGRESVRLSGELPIGDLLVEEIIKQKVAQPAKLDAQSLAIINKQDFDRIDILNKKLVINQEKMGEQMNALAEHEATLANLETKNAGDIELLSGQTASAVQMLKGAIEDTDKKNSTIQKALSQAIKETGEDLSDSLVAHETAKNPHRITKATIGLDKVENIKPEDMPVSKATKKELDKKADKKDIAEVEKKLTEKSDKIVKGIERMNMLGGVGGNELPIGGKKGYVLAKASDKTGDYEWKAGGGGVSIHNELEGRSADNAHPMSAITGLEDALDSKYDASNPSNYQTGTQVANSIATETTNRENADNGLQSQIDAITASSDVKDIVGTHAELESYDTSTLGNNDIIKVLQDETHSDETTYYRWSTTTETFTLIGEEGPYYTKSEANSTFVSQTRTVNSKALSANITLTASDVGALPSSTTIGDGTLTIQKNGTAVQTFTANQTGNVTANITVPTDTGDLTNGAGYITGITSLMVTTALGYTPANVTALSDYVTIAGAETITGAKTFTEPVTIQNGQGTGCLIVGANVNSSTLSNNQRKLARINAPSYANKDLGATLIGWDTSGDSDSPVTNKSYDSVCFGGMKKITNCTSPMSITFCVTDTRAATAAANKKYVLAMDANSAIFGVQPKYNGYNLATMNDLPTVNNATLTIQKNGTSVATFTANSSTNTTANITVPTTAADVSALPSSTKYGADLSYSSSTLTLLDQDGNALGNSVTISGGGNTNNLLDFKWVDHELSDQSWLNADTFSWQDGEVYSDAYNHLEDDYSNGTLQSETIGSYTIDYILAPDGHKIVLANNETTVANIYDETGVAWYYVLDRVNDRFKLPRTKYGFNGYRDAVGKYISAGLPNITGNLPNARVGSVYNNGTVGTGALRSYNDGATGILQTYSASGYYVKSQVDFNASNSNSIYGNSTTVQPPATQMYLYFYVGQFSQSATEQTAGLNASLFNDKADIDMGNVPSNIGSAAKSYFSGIGMPSNTYENITGSTTNRYTIQNYVAPANGYVAVEGTMNNSSGSCVISVTDSNNNLLYSQSCYFATGGFVRGYISVAKGNKVTINSSGSSVYMTTIGLLRFIYAQGEV